MSRVNVIKSNFDLEHENIVGFGFVICSVTVAVMFWKWTWIIWERP